MRRMPNGEKRSFGLITGTIFWNSLLCDTVLRPNDGEEHSLSAAPSAQILIQNSFITCKSHSITSPNSRAVEEIIGHEKATMIEDKGGVVELRGMTRPIHCLLKLKSWLQWKMECVYKTAQERAASWFWNLLLCKANHLPGFKCFADAA
ncbi:hypothetical protein GUJ93_ZPchr0012g20912 [Zizania palustris]|uniref:Uncharacterized protein n=1 Tax=Zizania palustris TaxID=103762 RepID=A0A8J6BQI9_ZIZPA|nr:hypothetical protein GUJ93_ZPchr0012g20912 [Zizania palustris]